MVLVYNLRGKKCFLLKWHWHSLKIWSVGTFQLYTRNEISLTLLLDPRQKINHYWQVSVILYTKKELIKLVYCINISNRLCQSNDLCNPFQFWDFKIPNTCQTIVGSFQHLQIRRKKLEKKKSRMLEALTESGLF